MVLAHLDNESSMNSLGFPLADVLSADADANNQDGTHFYRAGDPIIDHAQKARAIAEDAYRKAHGDLPSYVHFPVQRYERKR